MTDSPERPTLDEQDDQAALDAAAAVRKKQKKERRRAEETARIEAAKTEAVAQARAEWETASSKSGSSKSGGFGPLMLAIAGLCAAALIASVVLGVLYVNKAGKYDDLAKLNKDKETAETIAGKYAVNAATFSYADVGKWGEALKKGTAKELTSRFDVAVKTLTPLLQELQWSQTAELVAAKTVDVRDDRQFVVQVFVSTKMTSTQNPKGLNTITPYTITLDRKSDWLITDVAGIGDVAQDGSTGSGIPNIAPQDGGDAPATTPAATPTP